MLHVKQIAAKLSVGSSRLFMEEEEEDYGDGEVWVMSLSLSGTNRAFYAFHRCV